MPLTLHDGLAPRAVVVDLLDVAEVDVAVEDAVAALGAVAVIEGQGDDVLHVLRVLEGLDGRVEVVLVREVDALEDGALRVEQVPVVVAAAHAVLGQHPVGAGARPLPAAAEQAQLLAVPVVLGTDVGAWWGDRGDWARHRAGCTRSAAFGSRRSRREERARTAAGTQRCICFHPRSPHEELPPTLGPTLLPGPVEDFDVLELHADPGPQRHRLGGVVLVASFDGAVGMSPEGGRSHRVTSTGPFPTSPQHPPAPSHEPLARTWSSP